jgi:hypothetical protein
MYSIMSIYNIFLKTKRKERFEIILEPLQALIQISFLGFYPIGSKLNIHNNLLYIQPFGWSQTFSRTYNNDSKDDLFYLFNAVMRFNKFYESMPEVNNKSLFKLLKKLSIKGIDNLINTYNQVDNPALLHTLRMYKIFLEKDMNIHQNIESDSSNAVIQTNPGMNVDNILQNINITYANENKNIDDVFVNITKIYSIEDYNIIYNTLVLLENNPNNYNEYINGLNNILSPINSQIKKWINDNIVF